MKRLFLEKNLNVKKHAQLVIVNLNFSCFANSIMNWALPLIMAL